LRGRNSQDSQVRNESRRVAHRFHLDRSTQLRIRLPDRRTTLHAAQTPVAAGRVQRCHEKQPQRSDARSAHVVSLVCCCFTTICQRYRTTTHVRGTDNRLRPSPIEKGTKLLPTARDL
jgi:hypothetical protein